MTTIRRTTPDRRQAPLQAQPIHQTVDQPIVQQTQDQGKHTKKGLLHLSNRESSSVTSNSSSIVNMTLASTQLATVGFQEVG
ncbi:MAG: hypothetical protein ACK47M_17980 [Caldilinea sp.]